jgi:CBS-domain-containing membrane protein
LILDIDKHIRTEHIRRYLLQCSLAGAAVLVLLLVLDIVTQTVLIASLGASAFIAFAVPLHLQSSPRHMIGGYLVGIFAGCTMSFLVDWASLMGMPGQVSIIVFGALATSVAMFLMVVTRTEHPPAAALALGLVLNEWTGTTILVVLAGIVGLSALKRLVLPMLMDLL